MLSRYFEDYLVGESGTTLGRTVGEGDIYSFSYITGDFNQVHVDAEFARISQFGGRIAQGPCTLSIVTGLLHLQAPSVLGIGVNGLRLTAASMRYIHPVLIGDTISVRWKLHAKSDDETNPGRGFLNTLFSIQNQRAEVVADGEIVTSLVKKTAIEPNRGVASPTPEIFVPRRSQPPDYSRSYFYNDYFVGLGDMTGGRTITETDIVNFCGLSGNYLPLYRDEEFARNTEFRGTVAPELLPSAIAFGLLHRDAPILLGNNVSGVRGGHLGDKFRFRSPMRKGDTLRCYWEIVRMRDSQTKPDYGIIAAAVWLLNQRNEVVQEAEIDFMRGKRK